MEEIRRHVKFSQTLFPQKLEHFLKNRCSVISDFDTFYGGNIGTGNLLKICANNRALKKQVRIQVQHFDVPQNTDNPT